MSLADSMLESRMAEIRRGFDESFAVALPEQLSKGEPMLAITIEGEPFALRAQEISGVAVSKEKIVPVPSRIPELLGLTGIRGVVVPVFSLARLLGFDSERSQAHWLVFCGERQAPIALAFEAIDRLVEVSPSDVFAREEALGHRYVNATLREGATLRGVIGISALVEHIKTRGARK